MINAGQQRKLSERPNDLKRSRSARPTPAVSSRRGAAPEPAPAAERKPTLLDGDRQVLRAFRDYLMVPGEMLCFTSQDLAKKLAALQRLTAAGMLVAEKFPGAYSLTDAGFAMMGAKK